jgi:PadR family transcriptional regulator, regulatory protein PadR
MALGRRPSPQTTAVILALAKQDSSWRHGYDLCQTLDLKAGTVYPILIRLAERGLVETAWEQAAPLGRPPRHLYRLSPAGADYLAGLDAEAGSAHHATSRARSARPATGAAAG